MLTLGCSRNVLRSRKKSEAETAYFFADVPLRFENGFAFG